MGTAFVLDRDDLDRMLTLLAERGYEVIGPTVDSDAIGYGPVAGTDDLPVGLTDRQTPGGYSIETRGDDRLFGYVVGPHSWRRFLSPPQAIMWKAEIRDGEPFELPLSEPPKYAFVGVRPCDLAAIGIQDHIAFTAGRAADSDAAERREAAFIVAINCDEPGDHCFCVSMDTGPRASDSYDVALTEVTGADGLVYMAESGSPAGDELLAALGDLVAADAELEAEVDRLIDVARTRMGRAMNTAGVKELLQGNPDHPVWQELGERCLGCTNCTLVCPTCFCWSVEDATSLDGATASRSRRWDSCFTLDFSYIHGGPVRESIASRYRQWLTHKLAGWIDQFGMSGCVGCGRCITWCPVGIDLTEEIARMQADAVAAGAGAESGGDLT